MLTTVLLVESLAGCQQSAETDAQPAEIDTAAVRSVVDSLRNTVEDAVAMAGVETLVEAHAPDARLSLPGHPLVQGRDSIKAVLQNAVPSYATLRPNPTEVSIRGPSRAHVYGTATLAVGTDPPEEKQALYFARVEHTDEGWKVCQTAVGKPQVKAATVDLEVEWRQTERVEYKDVMDGTPVKDFRKVYAYDTDGNRIEERTEDWKNGQWVNDRRTVYAYNEAGKRTMEREETWEDSEWTPESRTTYAYDSDSLRTKTVGAEWKDGSWVRQTRTTFNYDDEGRKTKTIEEEWTNGTWTKAERTAYTHNEDGNVTKRLTETWRTDRWEKRNRSTLRYDEEGNRTFGQLQKWGSEGWWTRIRGIRTFNEAGRLTQEIRKSGESKTASGATRWREVTRWTYRYDEEGRRREVLVERTVGEQWVNKSRQEYTYDALGNRVEGFFWTWEDGEWMPFDRETYSYRPHE